MRQAGEELTGPFTWRGILRTALDHRRELILANVVALLATLVSVPVPLLMPLLVDEVLLEHPAALTAAVARLFPPSWHGPVLYITAILLATVLMRLAALGLGVWQTREFTLISKDVSYRIRRTLLQRLSSISMAEYEAMGSGAVASRFVTDIESIDNFLGVTLSKFLVAILTLVGVSVVLLWMHWQLALFILFMNPLVIYLTMLMGKKVKELKRRENSAFELFQQALTETLDAIQQIRASNREGHYLKRVIERAATVRNHSAAFSWRSDAAGRLSFAVFLVGFDLFRAVSMLMVVFSDLSIGMMMAVFGYLWFMMAPVQEVLNIQVAWYGAKAALKRLNELFALRQEPHYPHLRNPFAGRRTVSLELEEITFGYGEEPVLKGVTMEVEAGEKVALVGASGGGKSTLVQVILGLYPPDSGSLSFDRVPVEEIGLDVVREHVGSVLQHPALFNDTVRSNLTLGRELPEGRLWEVLEVAQLREVVRSLPQGLDTVIGRDGVRLSGGERQRLAVARMLLGEPKLVILDEATSALDAETEDRLHRALAEYLRGVTTLIVAHRLSAVRQADRVYVFEDGRIIEQGGHEDLLHSGGLYARLYGTLQRG